MIRLVTDQVLFGLGSYELRPEADPLLTHIAKAIQPLPNAVHVEGYTDSLPCSCSFGNDGLSFERAQTVLNFMGAAGFTIGDRHDAVAIPYGQRKPLAAEQPDDGQSEEPPRRDRDPQEPLHHDHLGAARRPRRGRRRERRPEHRDSVTAARQVSV